MAEPKTKPTDADPRAFVAAAAPAQRASDGMAVLELMSEVTGSEPVMWGPSMIGYGVYHYVSPRNPRTRGDWPKVGFSPRKSALVLYGIKDLPESEALMAKLGRYTEGVGCVYVKRLSDIDQEVLRQLVAIAWSRPDD